MVDVIIGGQYGSEGKGKVSNVFSRQNQYSAYMRVGGSNSGHTFYFHDVKYIFRVLPCCINDVQKEVNILLPAGSYIDVSLLQEELAIFEQLEIKVNLCIDDYAIVITQANKESEADIAKSIASTGCGIGAALKQRIERHMDDAPTFAKDCVELRLYTCDVSIETNYLLQNKEDILIEGTQGFGLSILHGTEWPYLTARDTTVMGVLSEAGISPYYLRDTYMVLRTYPIRVGGTSGPMQNELTWEEINRRKGGHYTFETTSVTKTIRRISEIDYELIKRAIRINRPTKLVMNFLDYIWEESCLEYYPSVKQLQFIKRFEEEVGQEIDYLGFDSKNIYRRCYCAVD